MVEQGVATEQMTGGGSVALDSLSTPVVDTVVGVVESQAPTANRLIERVVTTPVEGEPLSWSRILDPIQHVADSLTERLQPQLLEVLEPMGVIEISSAEKMFGAGSVLSEAAETASSGGGEQLILTDTPLFGISVLILFALFSLIIFFSRSNLRRLFTLTRGKIFFDQLLEERNHSFDMFLRSSIFFGFISVGIVGTKLVELYFAPLLMHPPLPWLDLVVPIALSITVMSLFWFEYFITLFVGTFVGYKEFAQRIVRLKILTFALFTYLATPLILLFALSTGVAMTVMLYTIVGLLILTIIYFIRISFALFFEARVSFFYWFLYLCLIEVLPIMTIVLLVEKSL